MKAAPVVLLGISLIALDRNLLSADLSPLMPDPHGKAYPGTCIEAKATTVTYKTNVVPRRLAEIKNLPNGSNVVAYLTNVQVVVPDIISIDLVRLEREREQLILWDAEHPRKPEVRKRWLELQQRRGGIKVGTSVHDVLRLVGAPNRVIVMTQPTANLIVWEPVSVESALPLNVPMEFVYNPTGSSGDPASETGRRNPWPYHILYLRFDRNGSVESVHWN